MKRPTLFCPDYGEEKEYPLKYLTYFLMPVSVLPCTYIFQYNPTGPPDAEIKSYSAEQTCRIGEILSKLAHTGVRNELAADDGILRIGSMARPNMGKSVFFEGFMRPLLAPVNASNRPRLSLYFEKTVFAPDDPFKDTAAPSNTIGESQKVRTQSFSHSHAAGLKSRPSAPAP